MADVAFVPEGHVFPRGARVTTHEARQSGDVLGEDRILLVGHGRAATLSLGEGFGGFADIGALPVSDGDSDLLDGGGGDGGGDGGGGDGGGEGRAGVGGGDSGCADRGGGGG